MAPNASSYRPIAFISSVCRGLEDLRAELADFLREHGCQPQLSEDPTFFVDPVSPTAIDACLGNVRSCHAFICILDRRYGCRQADRGNKSVTHLEYAVAREHQKNTFMFVRAKALADIESNKASPTSKPSWIENVSELEGLQQLLRDHTNGWIDQFNSVVDLKQRVLAKVLGLSQFEAVRTVAALSPMRLARLVFRPDKRSKEPNNMTGVGVGNHQKEFHVVGDFQNVTDQVVFDVAWGLCEDSGHNGCKGVVGAVGPRGRLSDVHADGEKAKFTFATLNRIGFKRVAWCVYRNAWGDWYRLEIPVLVEDEVSEHDRPWMRRQEVKPREGPKMFVYFGKERVSWRSTGQANWTHVGLSEIPADMTLNELG